MSSVTETTVYSVIVVTFCMATKYVRSIGLKVKQKTAGVSAV